MDARTGEVAAAGQGMGVRETGAEMPDCVLRGLKPRNTHRK